MTCLKAQSFITPFINDQLNIKELEEFIDHINSCSECKEELEVYYALLTAMKQLDEDKNLSDDYNFELNSKLERAQEKIIHVKFAYYRKKGILILIMIFVTVILSLQYNLRYKQKQNDLIESNFTLRRSFNDRRYHYYENSLKRYLEFPK